ncbi:MAG: glycosyltransferase family 4 protein [Candidatus Harrisonbacteria bacterium]|nr:glycosyltransferase family 4 protein [Candidatus Harrisonbacteria bacterium]
MRVCYLNHDTNPYTGSGRFCSFLIEALNKEIPDLQYKVLTREDLLPKNKFSLFLKFPKIRKEFKKYEIIHALDGWPYGFLAVLGAFGLRKKVIITAIGTGAVQPLYNWWKRPLLKWAYKKADKIVAVSNNTKKEILKIIPNLKIEVINHGVDYEKFQSLNPKLLYPKPYVLSVGAWKPRKGFDYSISAFEKLKDKFPDLKYVIVSKAPEEIKQKYDRVVFLENVSEKELISLYKNAELFILLPQDDNKDIEGFGLVFLEAAACGLPIIASLGTSAEDAVKDNGILVDSKDIQEVAKAISEIVRNEDKKTLMSENSVKLAKAMSWRRAVGDYLKIYK